MTEPIEDLHLVEGVEVDLDADRSSRLQFLLNGMYVTTDTNGELNAALTWLYFGLVMAMVDGVAAAQVVSELEGMDGWPSTLRTQTRENAKLAIKRSGKGLVMKGGQA